MHAFLFVGKDEIARQKAIQKKLIELKATARNHSIAKISDVRELGHTLSMTQPSDTAFIIENVDDASEEALNAFLKNLEEPQVKVTFILSAKSEQNVLETIRSRCEVIFVKSQLNIRSDDFTSFYKKDLSQRLTQIDAIKKREEAIGFIEKLIESAHNALVTGEIKPKAGALFLEEAEKTRSALYANGNVSLQLSNFIFRIS